MFKRVNLAVSSFLKRLQCFRGGNLLIASLCLASILLTGCSQTLNDKDLTDKFVQNESFFVQLRDLIQEGEYLTSVGYDNVGDFWLAGKEWINHQPPYDRYTQQEMLNLVGLSAERYEQYLNLLDLIGGYRVSKEPSEGRIVIHISKSGRASSGTALNIVYYSSTPIFLSYATYTEIGDGWYIEHIGD